jgi:hypothetical protein
MTALTEYLAAWPRRFDWQTHHCGAFVAGWIERATGRPALDAMPRVSGMREWCRYVDDSGGMLALTSELLRCQHIDPMRSAPGDILLFPGESGCGALGIRLHVQAGAVLSAAGAVVLCRLDHAQAAWPLSEVLA